MNLFNLPLQWYHCTGEAASKSSNVTLVLDSNTDIISLQPWLFWRAAEEAPKKGHNRGILNYFKLGTHFTNQSKTSDRVILVAPVISDQRCWASSHLHVRLLFYYFATLSNCPINPFIDLLLKSHNTLLNFLHYCKTFYIEFNFHVVLITRNPIQASLCNWTIINRNSIFDSTNWVILTLPLSSCLL